MTQSRINAWVWTILVGAFAAMSSLSIAQSQQQPRGENDAQALSRTSAPTRDLSNPDDRALYAVGYAHLDTQWRWDFETTIDEYLRATLVDNFELFRKHPEYVFNFTGSVRYEMMKEYYPELYEELKQHITAGRWRVSGSSVDEGDVNVPSPESIIRQVLYGNNFFRREFDKESVDFMLPDCFGFPASMPSIWAHCGLLGFSTQKLTWGSAVGIPFKIGVWEGPDGNGVIAALDPGPYVGGIEGAVTENPEWAARIADNGDMFGVWADYHYYGVGDQGGAPRADDVANYVASANGTSGDFALILDSSDAMYRDITPQLREGLPRYKGDMLLTEHSAGTLTSQSYMKRWNRKAEQLADAAERAATLAWLYTDAPYPRAQLERSWVRVLANQMHDILPGTSIPRAYTYSWNDEVLAMNGFADVLTTAVGQIASQMDTRIEGEPLVVFNPLSIDRADVVRARLDAPESGFLRVFDADGVEAPSQEVSRSGGEIELLFLARVAANSAKVFDVRQSPRPYQNVSTLSIDARTLENERYRVRVNDAGDVASIFDKANGRELLSRPHRLVLTYEKPRNWPAWNMDWADRQRPPIGRIDGEPSFRIVEDGPVRVSLEITRTAHNSTVTQRIQLAAGGAGDIVEFDTRIDWQSAGAALRAEFPLTVSNPTATYNWGLGTIDRGNNEPLKYEVPSHEWFSLSDSSGDYGVTIVEDSKFGSDKPADDVVRLTLLYSPGVRNWYMDQHSQDWGIHEMRYGLAGHAGDWRNSGSEWVGRRLNQPLMAFATSKHAGPLGPGATLPVREAPQRMGRHDLRPWTPQQVDLRTIKMAEADDRVIVRVQELHGRSAPEFALRVPAGVTSAHEVDGQERVIRELDIRDGEVRLPLTPFAIRAVQLDLSEVQTEATDAPAQQVRLPFDTDVASTDASPSDGAMGRDGRAFPAEMLPPTITSGGVEFRLGPTGDGQAQAVTCRGQTIELPDGDWDQLHLLIAATDDASAPFRLGHATTTINAQSWTGFIGQWDDRIWDREFPKVDFKGEGHVTAIAPGFIKRAPVAWFATHRHAPEEGNEAYKFSYLFRHTIDRTNGATKLRLPHDERIRVFAITVSASKDRNASPAWPLYDTLERDGVIRLRHNYDVRGDHVFTDVEPTGMVEIDREREFDLLSIGTPNAHDDVGADSGSTFRVVNPDGTRPPHPASGVVDGVAVRLNDGVVQRNEDDTRRSLWFDNEGRFTIDFGAARVVNDVRVYSWHRSNRAPQFFSLWGATSDEPPAMDFARGEHGEWELLAVVDTRELGDGDIHGSRVFGQDGHPLGDFRHLLWIAEDVGEGTFFGEIDIDLGESR